MCFSRLIFVDEYKLVCAKQAKMLELSMATAAQANDTMQTPLQQDKRADITAPISLDDQTMEVR